VKESSELLYTDPATGLTWPRNFGICKDFMHELPTLSEAKKWVKRLRYDGYHDWRVPTTSELGSLFQLGGEKPYDWFKSNGFRVLFGQGVPYWTSEGFIDQTDSTVRVFASYMLPDGEIWTTELAPDERRFVWPVRGGRKQILHELLYTDPETGLMWPKNGRVDEGEMTWDNATDWVNIFDYAGYNDWRLPSIKEFKAFIKRGDVESREWLDSNRFYNVSMNSYWSSSEVSTSSQKAHVMSPCPGSSFRRDKSEVFHLWPVRDGKRMK
jgi:hypothetical protein